MEELHDPPWRPTILDGQAVLEISGAQAKRRKPAQEARLWRDERRTEGAKAQEKSDEIPESE